MAKNRKTVLKSFTYLQCDDFADYLSQMAAQGWHFKEWGAGLVFEKGEPEKVTYAVEVFIHGSEYDLRPDVHTLNFADYCEAAGWKLVDAKMKFVIFKQIRPDAVPILTPEERLKNASKAYRGQLIWQSVLSLLWLGNMLLRLLPEPQLINTLFSDYQLLMCAFWIYYAFCTAVKCVLYGVWVFKTRKRCKAGESKILNQSRQTLLHWVSNCILIVLLGGQVATLGSVALIIYLAITLILLIPAVLFAIFRPDRDTFIGFQIVMPLVLILLIVFIATFTAMISDDAQLSTDGFPLVYEDLGYDAGKIESSSHASSASIFGMTYFYSIFYEDACIVYQVYETEHEWILDLVWDENIWTDSTIVGSVTDCTALWDAEAAVHNGRDYIVRYGGKILILDFFALEMTEEYTTIIRNALDLED